jgi:hypothetical protein
MVPVCWHCSYWFQPRHGQALNLTSALVSAVLLRETALMTPTSRSVQSGQRPGAQLPGPPISAGGPFVARIRYGTCDGVSIGRAWPQVSLSSCHCIRSFIAPKQISSSDGGPTTRVVLRQHTPSDPSVRTQSASTNKPSPLVPRGVKHPLQIILLLLQPCHRRVLD